MDPSPPSLLRLEPRPYPRGLEVTTDGAFVSGILLRTIVLLELDRRSPDAVSIGELHAAIQRLGFVVRGEANKAISDSLRCELARGRVVRVARGRYRLGVLPGTTRWRCRQRVAIAVSLRGGTNGSA